MARYDTLLFWKLLAACRRTKSIARACALLGVSVSTASKLIASFEAESGLTLLDRSTRPAGFTADLVRLLPVAARMLTVHQEADRLVQTLQAERDGNAVRGRLVRICLPLNVRNDDVISKLLDYAQATPGLRLEFFGDEGYKRLLAGDADIAQFGFHPKNSLIRADYIRTNCFLMLASRAFAERFGLPATVEELSRFPVAIRNPVNRSFSRRLERGEETYFLPDGDNIIYADTMTCRSLLVAGRAIAIDVSNSTVLEELKADKLVPVLNGWHRHPNDTYVCCQMKQSDDPVINDLMAIIRTTLQAATEDRWEHWFRHFGLAPELVKGAL